MIAAKLEVSQPFGDRQGRASSGFVVVARTARQAPSLGAGSPPRRAPGPAGSSRRQGSSPAAEPTSPSAARFQGEVCVHLGRGAADVQRFLHGLPEALSVVLEGAGPADALPDRGLLPRIALEAERPAEQGQALVDLVAADGQLRRPPRPRDGLGAQALGLPFPAGPGQIKDFRKDSLGVVVRQQRRVLVLALAVPLEPRRRSRRAAAPASPSAGSRRRPRGSARA